MAYDKEKQLIYNSDTMFDALLLLVQNIFTLTTYFSA
jgi:hypothetical protein